MNETKKHLTTSEAGSYLDGNDINFLWLIAEFVYMIQLNYIQRILAEEVRR